MTIEDRGAKAAWEKIKAVVDMHQLARRLRDLEQRIVAGASAEYVHGQIADLAAAAEACLPKPCFHETVDSLEAELEAAFAEDFDDEAYIPNPLDAIASRPFYWRHCPKCSKPAKAVGPSDEDRCCAECGIDWENGHEWRQLRNHYFTPQPIMPQINDYL